MRGKSIETEFLKESNAIEGVYDGSPSRQARRAWSFLINQDVLSIGAIFHCHKVLMLHLLGSEKGYFRTRPVWIGGREGMEWSKIPYAMDEWIIDAMTSVTIPGKEGNNIKLDHISFEKIHPFIDGNGRIGRILLNWQRLKAGLPILVIKDAEKDAYYDWFREGG